MAILLEIKDGNPWYLSTDIWTVPGNDPEGAPGFPRVGDPCYLWARAYNNGKDRADNATVRFYWANPGVGFDRNTANYIGSSFVSLDGGQSADVLCLTPWFPVYVNEGHECVLAEAFHTSDPLPPGPAFNVPTDRHVAQRNLSVVNALQSMSFHFAFEAHNASRSAQEFCIRAKPGELAEIQVFEKVLGNIKLPAKSGRLAGLGFVEDRCPDQKQIEAARPVVEGLKIAGCGRRGLTLVGKLEGPAALVHVTQEAGGRVVGGLSVLVIGRREKQ